MPTKAKGYVKKVNGEYRTYIRYADGTRKWITMHGVKTEAQARKRSAEIAEGAKLEAAPSRAARGDSVADYAEAWLVHRKTAGLLSVADDRMRVYKHIVPAIGHLSIKTVGKGDLESLRDTLDTKILSGELAWKTAANIWTLVTAMFRDASAAKRAALRVRDDNPVLGVLPPDKGENKGKQYLYPQEFLRLVSCPEVPLHWRRIYALTTYLCLRSGEIEALQWGDVRPGHVLVGRARQTNGTLGTPKSGRARAVPIEPTLAPLLARPGRADTLVIHVRHRWGRADQFRKHLLRAGVTRAALHTASPTHVRITFHDLRATGITWLAVRGDDPLKIKSRAGHSDFKTTELYIREAEVLRDGFGEVFPALPLELSGESIGDPVVFTVNNTEKYSVPNGI